jgi:hypothetical protein
MELVSIMRLMWARRLWVAVAFVLAVLVGLTATYKIKPGFPPELTSRHYHVGVASISMLIDTPSSQVADLRPPIGAEVLGTRASLFASLISTPPMEALIAKRVGIPVDELTTSPTSSTPAVPSRVAEKAPQGASGAATYSLTVSTEETLPIIAITAEAPDAERAAVLANGTFEALKDYLRSVADQQNIPRDRRPAVTALGSATSADAVRGPGRVIGFIGAILVFGVICVSIVLGSGLARSWREAAAIEQAGVLLVDEPEARTAVPLDPPPSGAHGSQRLTPPPSDAAVANADGAGGNGAASDSLEKPEHLTVGRWR